MTVNSAAPTAPARPLSSFVYNLRKFTPLHHHPKVYRDPKTGLIAKNERRATQEMDRKERDLDEARRKKESAANMTKASTDAFVAMGGRQQAQRMHEDKVARMMRAEEKEAAEREAALEETLAEELARIKSKYAADSLKNGLTGLWLGSILLRLPMTSYDFLVLPSTPSVSCLWLDALNTPSSELPMSPSGSLRLPPSTTRLSLLLDPNPQDGSSSVNGNRIRLVLEPCQRV